MVPTTGTCAGEKLASWKDAGAPDVATACLAPSKPATPSSVPPGRNIRCHVPTGGWHHRLISVVPSGPGSRPGGSKVVDHKIACSPPQDAQVSLPKKLSSQLQETTSPDRPLKKSVSVPSVSLWLNLIPLPPPTLFLPTGILSLAHSESVLPPHLPASSADAPHRPADTAPARWHSGPTLPSKSVSA